MASEIQEFPEQDIDEIRCLILGKKSENGYILDQDLFVDETFLPDITSLTYVYSGDDKYDRMQFKRPHELYTSPCLYGVDGVCDVSRSWRHSRDREWLLYALGIISLNPHYMERFMPDYREFTQSFLTDYIGAFQFVIWRFGKWTDIVVDDSLPVLNGRLCYCPPMGNPMEFWGPLIEKAYAKCHKTYEAIETGNTLHVLTDLTGAICEHFKLKEAETPCMFQTIYKSFVNQSFITCWRHPRSHGDPHFKPRHNHWSPSSTGANAWQDKPSDTQALDAGFNNLFILTAVTKFPLRDGLLLEMVRIMDPYCRGQIPWIGNFSPSDTSSWHRVNPTFLTNYRPRECRNKYEFWMTFCDFCRHYGDVIICSSPEPYRKINPDLDRKYKPDVESDFTNLSSPQSLSLDHRNSDVTVRRLSGTFKAAELSRVTSHRRQSDGFVSAFRKKTNKSTKYLVGDQDTEDLSDDDDGMVFKPRRGASNKNTDEEVTMITRPYYSHPMRRVSELEENSVTDLLQSDNNNPDKDRVSCGPEWGSQDVEGTLPSSSSSTSKTSSRLSTDIFLCKFARDSLDAESNQSLASVGSQISAQSATDVKVKLGSGAPTRTSPLTNDKSSTKRSKTRSSHLFEARMDYFKPHGGWKELVFYFGKWRKYPTGGIRPNGESQSKNKRIPLVLNKVDNFHEISYSSSQGKCHIIIALLQDYRLGAKAGNGMPRPIGFALYKTKGHEKDIRRCLTKLTLIGDVRAESEAREVTCRFDLDPGNYIIVPYTQQPQEEGEFLLRVLGEREESSDKGACSLS